MLVIVTAGCGDDGGSGPPPPIDGVEAGARLRPQAWDAGGGATMLRGWLDTQLDDVACAFVPAVDGRYRCLPVTGSTDTTFADAACTVPALVVDACAPTPTWALGPRRDLAGCDGETGSPVLAIDGDHPLDVIYEGAPGACSPRIVEADVRAFATTTEAAPTAFVGADLVIGDADAAGLAPYTLVADDGSRAAVGVWHASCTCRMGSRDDPMAVTDPAGRVHGIGGLRVVDASIFPVVPCANTNLPTIMTAEKIADAILDEPH